MQHGLIPAGQHHSDPIMLVTDSVCLFADYMMPEMSGTEFCTIFRETIPRSVSLLPLTVKPSTFKLMLQ